MSFLQRLGDWVAGTASGSSPMAGNAGVGRKLRLGDMMVSVQAVIAEGGFGVIFRVADETGRQYALKKLLAQEKPQVSAIRREVKFMQRLNSGDGHPHILRLERAVCSDLAKLKRGSPAEFLLLTELCPGGNLMEHIQLQSRPLPPRKVALFLEQAVSAVAFLHAQTPAVIHRDVKAENFLLAADGSLRLCDFGSATCETLTPADMSYHEKVAAEEKLNQVTTPQNRTPEMLDMHSGRPINEKVDIWALGCLLYTLCYRAHPFEDGSKLAIVNGKYPAADDPAYAAFTPLIEQQLLNPDPTFRPSADKIEIPHIE